MTKQVVLINGELYHFNYETKTGVKYGDVIKTLNGDLKVTGVTSVAPAAEYELLQFVTTEKIQQPVNEVSFYVNDVLKLIDKDMDNLNNKHITLKNEFGCGDCYELSHTAKGMHTYITLQYRDVVKKIKVYTSDELERISQNIQALISKGLLRNNTMISIGERMYRLHDNNQDILNVLCSPDYNQDLTYLMMLHIQDVANVNFYGENEIACKFGNFYFNGFIIGTYDEFIKAYPEYEWDDIGPINEEFMNKVITHLKPAIGDIPVDGIVTDDNWATIVHL